jgi:hypothetical protein
VLGSIARDLEPYIEADSAALLVSLLTTAGIALGRQPYIPVTSGQHAILFTAVVGETGDNKSDAWWPIQLILAQLAEIKAESDHAVLSPRRFGGLSTGEGLLHQIRDARRSDDGATVVEPGVDDKRLLIVEPELARVLAVMYREGNTLSMTLRELYDSSDEVRSSPKGNPITATGGHVGLIGHITPRELERKLREVELFNGFANRFMWVLTGRQKSLPNPPIYSKEEAKAHAHLLAAALAQGRELGAITRDDQAAHVWNGVYESLRTGERDGAPGRAGLAREVCARAHVQVTRMAAIFSALDGSATMRVPHQDAALAVWDYSEATAAYLFSGVSGDPITEVIADALVKRGPMTRTDISKLFSRHQSKADIDGALADVLATGRACSEQVATSGRPMEVWDATQAERERRKQQGGR